MMGRGLQRSWMVVGRRLFNGLENRSTLLTPRLIPYSSDVLHGSRFIYPTSHRIDDTLSGVGVAVAFRSYSAVAERIIKDDDSPIPPPSSSSSQPIKEIVLYQYAACPFCNKVKAFLDFYGLPYKLVEVNPISKKEIKWSDYKKVPILVVDGQQLSDSTEIISTLYQRLSPTSDDLSGTRDAEEEKWRRWVDEHLVHMLAPNIYRTPLEALESFDYITTKGNFTRLERWTGKYAGATAMYFISKKLKKRHNIQDERKALYDAVETWIGGLSDRPFMGGARPNLADLAVFGVLRPIRHLQAGRDLIANTKIGPWYDRVETLVGESSENRGV
ncbi:hypothetical protein QJS10_CPB18g00008 [Acorus calamus]|uniref:Prostaglandin E synthase 2 n=1 Tax=Acorus calamus TaxID=4465 RepID=A0AAV9CQJ1_ACOCL|nr:hypothetical protein QJS10_CPB18g00008 [Acorus calamus]